MNHQSRPAVVTDVNPELSTCLWEQTERGLVCTTRRRLHAAVRTAMNVDADAPRRTERVLAAMNRLNNHHCGPLSVALQEQLQDGAQQDTGT